MAAEQIANLAVFVRGDASFLARDLDRGIRDASQKVKVSTIALGNLIAEGIEAGVEAAGRAIAGLAAHVKASMDDIRDVMQSATTMDVSTEWLSSMQSAYRQLGGEAQDLRDAMMDLFERTAEAATDPTGDAGESFQLLKLDVEAIRKLAPEKQFEEVYKALSKVKDAGARLYIARSMMSDSGGDAMLKLINAGEEGLRRMREEAELFGTIVRDDVAAEVALSAQMTASLQEAWKGVGIHLSAAVAPYLKLALDYVTNMVKDAGGMRELVDQWVVKTIDWVGWLNKGWEISKAIWSIFEAAGSVVAGIGHTLYAGFQVAVKGIEVLIQDLYKDLTEIYNKIIKTIEDAVNGLLRGIEKTFSFIRESYNDLRNLLGLSVTDIGPGSAATIELPRATVPDQPDYSELEAAVQYFEDSVTSSFEAVQAAGSEAWDEVSGLFDEGGPDASLFAGLEDARQGLQDTAKAATEARQVWDMTIVEQEKERKKAQEAADREREKALRDAERAAARVAEINARVMEEVRDRNRETVNDMVSGWITGTARMSDVLSRWATRTIEQFVQVALWGNKAAGGSLGGLLGGLVASGGGAVAGGGLWSSALKFFGGFFAEGGRPPLGKISVVGEEGAELFIPDQAGTIVPQSALDGAAAFSRMEGTGGGGQITIVNNYQSGLTQAELAPMVEENNQNLLAQIQDMIARGGSFRRRLQT